MAAKFFGLLGILVFPTSNISVFASLVIWKVIDITNVKRPEKKLCVFERAREKRGDRAQWSLSDRTSSSGRLCVCAFFFLLFGQ